MGQPHYFSDSPAGKHRPGVVSLRVGDLNVELATDGGVFAADEVDWGTRYLLAEAPRPPEHGPLLDLGCGYGAIAVALSRWAPRAPLWAVDVNPRALALCRANLDRHAAGNPAVVCRPEEVPADVRFAAIYSNPPIRIGKAALHDLLATWLDRLTHDGQAFLVVNKHLGSDSLARWLNEGGRPTTRLRSRRGYRILEVAAQTGDTQSESAL
ncbi:class I SAM-dependent methyltransferase [Candidatus Poriferisocius sp.]|uniref:class I SAM-dependent methyltransferase n=1 Tax=Candidatus Poriferisocius sp. TaxID=3101276 RepID=UPI003B5AAF51